MSERFPDPPTRRAAWDINYAFFVRCPGCGRRFDLLKKDAAQLAYGHDCEETVTIVDVYGAE